MTRINLVPPEELTDQHLFAEFREIKMVPKALQRSLKARGVEGVLDVIPPFFTLGKGHVSFFYDKGLYLRKRYELLKTELAKRGVAYNKDSLFDPEEVMQLSLFNNDWQPSPRDFVTIRNRIAEKIAMKPQWYRHS